MHNPLRERLQIMSTKMFTSKWTWVSLFWVCWWPWPPIADLWPGCSPRRRTASRTAWTPSRPCQPHRKSPLHKATNIDLMQILPQWPSICVNILWGEMYFFLFVLVLVCWDDNWHHILFFLLKKTVTNDFYRWLLQIWTDEVCDRIWQWCWEVVTIHTFWHFSLVVDNKIVIWPWTSNKYCTVI